MNADGSDMIRLSTDQPGDFPGDLFPAWQPIPDATPPTVNCTASPNLLWPPNHTLRPITVTVNVADTGTGPAGFKLVSITSNQADSSSGGDPPNDIQGWTPGTPDTNVNCEQSVIKSSRTYTLTYEGRSRPEIPPAAPPKSSCRTTAHSQGGVGASPEVMLVGDKTAGFLAESGAVRSTSHACVMPPAPPGRL
jgi:hypothetical protein